MSTHINLPCKISYKMRDGNKEKYLEGAVDISEGLAVGIVAVNGKSLHRDNLGDSLQQLADSAGGTDSDGVTQ